MTPMSSTPAIRPPRRTINRGPPSSNPSHHLTPHLSLITPTHSRSKASTRWPELHQSLPLQRRRGAVDWSHPRRSCWYQEDHRRRLRRLSPSPPIAGAPVSPHDPHWPC